MGYEYNWLWLLGIHSAFYQLIGSLIISVCSSNTVVSVMNSLGNY